ncbi:ABC transporter ATP-binding protein [Thermosipho atlanticus]|uniref:Iron complex transport system ATP-binding protein n=1 Tax=Thermosipho atlanticus DSM 15807 TaxID=1123380 RepID=A0A1M5QQ57_9BACT|nr:ABC transporter ATP-binding protein [Thermosipho atlanticus]SHH16235.1 iron complex transport system ATP-binding protein [Thermosipho atlanticus DSM 15807]
MNNKILEVKNLCFSYENFSLNNLNISLKKGTFVGIIGPNGAGKSTTLNLIAKLLKPKSGKIILFGKDIRKLNRLEIAKLISFVRQDFNPAFEFKVKDIVEMGGYHKSRSFFSNCEDLTKIKESLKIVGLENFENRSFSTLSGGEQRRALIARSLYQETPIILVDELTAHLDISHSIKIVEILKQLTKFGKSVLAAFHNINIAAKYCDYIYALKNGKIIFEGIPKNVIYKENIQQLYETEVEILPHPTKNYPIVIF